MAKSTLELHRRKHAVEIVEACKGGRWMAARLANPERFFNPTQADWEAVGDNGKIRCSTWRTKGIPSEVMLAHKDDFAKLVAAARKVQTDALTIIVDRVDRLGRGTTSLDVPLAVLRKLAKDGLAYQTEHILHNDKALEVFRATTKGVALIGKKASSKTKGGR